MSNEWRGIIAAGTVGLGAFVTLAVMRLRLLQSSERRFTTLMMPHKVIGKNDSGVKREGFKTPGIWQE